MLFRSGQDQVSARNLVDVLVVLITPAGGDDIQWEKAGMMEAADVVAVNKSDLAGADATAAGLTAMLGLAAPGEGKSPPPIVKIIAGRGEGIDELWRAISRCAGAVDQDSRREKSHQRRILNAMQERLEEWFRAHAAAPGEVRELLERSRAGTISRPQAIDELLRRFAESFRSTAIEP